jgi:DNA-binding beta-propeller fold protein YncE
MTQETNRSVRKSLRKCICAYGVTVLLLSTQTYQSAGATSSHRAADLVEPTSLAVGSRSLWVTEYASNEVVQLNRDNGRVIRVFRSASGLSGPKDSILIGNQLWVADYGSNKVAIFNASTGALLSVLGKKRFDIGAPIKLLSIHGKVLVLNSTRDSFSIFNATNHNFIRNVRFGHSKVTASEIYGPIDMAVGGSALWITMQTSRADLLLHLDVTTDHVVSSIAVEPLSSNADFGHLAATGSDSFVTTANGTKIAEYPIGGGNTPKMLTRATLHLSQVSALAVGRGWLWILNRASGTVVIASTTDGSLIRSFVVANPAKSDLFGMLVLGDLWVLDGLGSITELNASSGSIIHRY